MFDKFPQNPDDPKYKYVVNGHHLVKILKEDIGDRGISPYHLPTSNSYRNNMRRLRVFCIKKCRAVMTYVYNSENKIYELLSCYNSHSHQVFFKTKREQLSGNNGQIYQNLSMKKNYQLYSKVLYVNAIQINNIFILVLSGLNSSMEICIFGMSLFKICSQEKVRQTLQKFANQNKHPDTIVSMNQTLLQICKEKFNSVCIYCFEEISPNLRIRQGIMKLLQQTYTHAEWDAQQRKTLLMIHQADMPSELKRIFNEYKKFNLKNMPKKFIGLGVQIAHKEFIYQHCEQYGYKFLVEEPKNWPIFLRSTPKIIQTQLPDQQFQELSLIMPSQVNYNAVSLQLGKKYSSYAIKFILGQQNRAMLCDIFPKASNRYLVRQKNEGEFQVYREKKPKEPILQMIEEQLQDKDTVKPQTKAVMQKQMPSLWQCTCQLMTKTGMPCCHIMKLLIRNGRLAGDIDDYIDKYWMISKENRENRENVKEKQEA